MIAAGPKPNQAFTEGFFQVAAEQKPKPQTVALAAEDAEFAPQRLRRRPRQRQEVRLQSHLRQKLSARHDRFLADYPRAAGGQRRSRGDLFLSAQLGRHCADGQRARLQAEDARRRNGRTAGDGVQGQAQIEAQRLRQLRDLGAVAENAGAGGRRSSRATRSEPKPKASIRSAIISAAGVTPISRCSAQASKAPKRSTTPSSPTTCTATSSTTIMAATSASARKANGPSAARFRCNITASPMPRTSKPGEA